MKAVVVLFPGTNREHDMIIALERISGHKPSLVWHGDSILPSTDLVVLPGGFSYGDYLRAGAMAARSPVMRSVVERAEAGLPVLGVCNGFQILTETGLLPGALMRNAELLFVCKRVALRVEHNNSRFTQACEAGQVITVPVAHHDGNYFADRNTLDRLEGEGQVLFRYCGYDGVVDAAHNPNGSQHNIAGITNEAGNVLGMMPHPENAVDPLHGGTDGRTLFQSLVEAVA